MSMAMDETEKQVEDSNVIPASGLDRVMERGTTGRRQKGNGGQFSYFHLDNSSHTAEVKDKSVRR